MGLGETNGGFPPQVLYTPKHSRKRGLQPKTGVTGTDRSARVVRRSSRRDTRATAADPGRSRFPYVKLEVISRHPLGRQQPTPLLFIHGMLHGAWCWDVHFLDYFARHGFAAHAVNLRGHGSSEGREKLRWTRIADFVEDVVDATRQLPRPPVLIGHSMGGFVIQKYLEDYAAPAAVLLSSPPPVGLGRTAFKIARRHPFVFARVNVTLSLLPVIATPQLAREAFFSADFPDAELHAFGD